MSHYEFMLQNEKFPPSWRRVQLKINYYRWFAKGMLLRARRLLYALLNRNAVQRNIILNLVVFARTLTMAKKVYNIIIILYIIWLCPHVVIITVCTRTQTHSGRNFRLLVFLWRRTRYNNIIILDDTWQTRAIHDSYWPPTKGALVLVCVCVCACAGIL